MARTEWSDEELDTIKRMWDEGATALQISRKLDGKSRSSVLAKARRLKLSSRKGGPKPKKPPADMPPPKKPKKKYKPTAEREKISKTAYGEKCSLEDLKPGQCRWPVGDPDDKENFGFCAAEVDEGGDVYCARHKSIAYS